MQYRYRSVRINSCPFEAIGAAFVRLAQQGRAKIGYATPLALYSIRQVKSGRRFGTNLNIKDVTSPHAQLNKGITVATGIKFEAFAEGDTAGDIQMLGDACGDNLTIDMRHICPQFW